MNQAVAETTEHALEQPTSQGGASTIMAVIERAARDPNMDVGKMERLYSMYQTEMGRQAEGVFNSALSAAQKQMKRVSADATNPQTKSKYASYAALDRALRPIYTDLGFSISFGEEDSPKDEHIRVVAYVSHEAGHTRTYHRDIPVSTTGLKGNQNMTPTHASASGASYGMRYLLKMIFNVAVGEDDDDGNGAEPDPEISANQLGELQKLVDEAHADVPRFLEYMAGVCKKELKDLADIPHKHYETARGALQQKVDAVKRAASKQSSEARPAAENATEETPE